MYEVSEHKLVTMQKTFLRGPRRMRWTVRVARIRNVYKVLIGKRKWKMPLGRPNYRWTDSIKSDVLG